MTLKRSYAKKIGKMLVTTKVPRDIRIKNKIRTAVRAELAAQIPLVYYAPNPGGLDLMVRRQHNLNEMKRGYHAQLSRDGDDVVRAWPCARGRRL